MFGRGTELEALRHELATARARIAELEAAQARFAREDRRTRVLTLDAFRVAADRELERARRGGHDVSLALFDLDGFRALNALHGPEAGDAALAALADGVAAVTRTGDVLGRTGADEIAVVLPDTDVDGALRCCARLIAAFERGEVPGAGWVTVSAGAAPCARGMRLDGILAAAADGVRRARLAGGGRAFGPTGPGGAVLPAEAHKDVIDALATTLTERDQYTGEHSESVVELTVAVAAAMGADAQERDHVATAALLHDIGKVAIPDEVLHKPAPLNDAEWVLMREHPVIGERILRAIPGLGPVAKIVRHEHERFDGGGYPDGLRGDAIPLGSRLILACDTYHAMTSDRPYRARMPHAEAVAELARCAGSQFDPRVTEALIGHLHHLQQSGRLDAA